MENRKIRELHERWKFNADLMTCQECGYSVIATRMHEEVHHAAGCKNAGEPNPWLQLAEVLQVLKGGRSVAENFAGIERECCGTFFRTPHRASCKKFRGKKTHNAGMNGA